MTYFKNHVTTIGLIGFAGFVTGWQIEGDLGFAVLTGAGALAAGALVARLFGAAGIAGWILAGFGAVLATALGAAAVATAMGVPQAAAGALGLVADTLIADWLPGLRWCVLMATAHLVAREEESHRLHIAQNRNSVLQGKSHNPAPIRA